ncbi:MAG: 16S rRNA (cytosine(1402)-N(4))-methyltransferase RsmH [Candidatus Sungbacteria bacterium]|nr:16S rRNA (cytosine(1402)-N(4))-methyltransferase RsmH [Candidatus Sungbacteria bacterium]
MVHIPVLLEEVIEALDPKSGEDFIDATVGEGGHAEAILEKISPSGVLLCIDRDSDQLERARANLARFGERAILRNGSFSDIQSIAAGLGNGIWKGILIDLGWSSAQKERSGRGFTFQNDEPLDMRYDDGAESNTQSAKDIINAWSLEEIELILREYGQERFAGSIARAIGEARKKGPLISTFQLRAVVEGATPSWYKHRRIPPATKTFQALRIAVNQEFEELEKGLEGAVNLLPAGGKLIVISFHSGEDRIVKNALKALAKEQRGAVLTKKPIIASSEERERNPRSRSAKMRAFIRS